MRKSVINKKQKNNTKSFKKYRGFTDILPKTDDNNITFKKCILPSIDNIFNRNTVCLFAYGHTGSGKTHTILGYNNNNHPGMYSLSVEYINKKLCDLNKNIYKNEDKLLISARFAELYQGKIRDLFGNLVECHVREDDDGNINIRGPTIKDNLTGEVRVQALTPFYVKQNESNKLINKVTESLKYRKTGSSGVHDESSRSHCFLEIELITNKLNNARYKLWKAEGEVVPIGKQKDELLNQIYEEFFAFIRTNKNPNKSDIKTVYVPDMNRFQKYDKLKKEFDILEGIRIQKENELKKIISNSPSCVTGTIVFIDLAGNEWGSDAKNIIHSDIIQQRERKEINRSLLSLKECIRALHSHKKHVPFRDSKLTMVLRPHLKSINSTAIMIANLSPSQKHIKKTFNTLSYSSLVAKA